MTALRSLGRILELHSILNSKREDVFFFSIIPFGVFIVSTNGFGLVVVLGSFPDIEKKK